MFALAKVHKKSHIRKGMQDFFLIKRDDFGYSIILISLAGLPPTMALAGTSLVTTAIMWESSVKY